MILAKKSLGQNFLKDKNIIKKIINLSDIKNKNIIEIGPGSGALTNEILEKKPKSLNLIEKDTFLAEELKLKYDDKKSIKVYNEDILRFNLDKIIKEETIIFGNLPYNISSQILVKILRAIKWPTKISNIILMFQKELGHKIISKFPSRDYGRLSILTNYRLKCINKFYVSPNCFFPKPKITSIVINLKPKLKTDFKIKKVTNLEKVTNILFSNKRKMIKKNLKKILSENDINKINNLKLNLRPSNIEPSIYYKITELYEKV
jgi:16S rRNA (adenine1518-N6/adenine1519-N6)-dimethyltransferase